MTFSIEKHPQNEFLIDVIESGIVIVFIENNNLVICFIYIYMLDLNVKNS